MSFPRSITTKPVSNAYKIFVIAEELIGKTRTTISISFFSFKSLLQADEICMASAAGPFDIGCQREILNVFQARRMQRKLLRSAR